MEEEHRWGSGDRGGAEMEEERRSMFFDKRHASLLPMMNSNSISFELVLSLTKSLVLIRPRND